MAGALSCPAYARRMRPHRTLAAVLALVLAVAGCARSAEPGPEPTASPSVPASPSWADAWKAWPAGPNPDGNPDYWPIGVWMQNPDRTFEGRTSALAYQQLGVNLDVTVNAWPACAWCPAMEDELVSAQWSAAMWAGGDYRSATFPGVERAKAKPEVGRRIVMWGLDDEPDIRRDNAADTTIYPTNFKTFGDKVRAADPTRPVYANYGKAMAVPEWNGYHEESPGGTGTYAGDMDLYCSAVDVLSVDFYGWTDPYERPDQKGAWTYGRAIDSARQNCGPDKLVLGFVEGAHPWQSTAPDAPDSTITPDQLEAAVWNVVAHGANGLIYFAHHFDNTGTVYEDGMLRLPAVRARVGEVNQVLTDLAPVLNAKPVTGEVSVDVPPGSAPVTFQHKRRGANYVIAVADGNEQRPLSSSVRATFTVPLQQGVAEVVGENRTVPIAGGRLVDDFEPYGHHVYRFPG
jgi:hypothetical protein